jgi:hypothetical protein
MNIIELAKQAGMEQDGEMWFSNLYKTDMDVHTSQLEAFAKLVAAHEREVIMKSIEELRPVEDNPILQNKPAAFWIENFRQIVYTRGEA